MTDPTLSADETAPADRTPEDHDELHPDSLYIMVFVALVVLTLLEVAGVLLDWPFWLTLSYVLGLAVAEAVLIAAFFMHLKWDSPMLRRIALTPIFFLVVLIIGVGLTHPDSPSGDVLAWCGL